MTNNWQIKRLDEVANVTMGQSPTSKSYNDRGIGVPFFQGKPSNIDNFGVANPYQYTTEPTKVVEAGTALMTVRAPVGDIFTSPVDVCIGRGLSGIKANADVSQKYLNYQLQFASQQFHALSQGSTFTAINSSDLKGIQVRIPELPIQHKIVDILSSIDEAIQKTDQIIQKSEELKSGFMIELFTKGIGHKKFKKTKLGEIPDGWEAVSVGQLCDCIVPGRNKPKSFSGNIPWITTPNIKDSRIDYKSNINFVSKDELLACGNKTIPINSVIMTCVGEFGIVAVVDQEISINQQLHAFLPSNQVTPTFLRLSLESQKEQMYNLATKTSVPYLNKTNCNSILITKPPYVEQEIITKIITSIEDRVLINKRLLSNLIGIKNGLMHDIFNQKVLINKP